MACTTGDENRDTEVLAGIDSVGSVEGPADAFAFVSDAAWLDDSTLIVVDAGTRTVHAFDSGRSSEPSNAVVGRRGAGPGEYQGPRFVAAAGARMAVYDEALGRVVVFGGADNASQWQTDAAFVEDFEASEDVILLTTGVEGATRIKLFTWTGELLGERLVGEIGGTPVRAAHTCLASGKAFLLEASGQHAYPLTLPDLSVDSSDAIPILAGSTWADESAADIGLLGFECDHQWLIAALADPARDQLLYVVKGRETGSRRIYGFRRSEEGVVEGPGFLTDLRFPDLLTYRTKPFSTVVRYRLGPSGEDS